MNSNTKFDLLGNISHVNPPYYLLTRIQERIKKKQQDYLSQQWQCFMFLGLILIGILMMFIVMYGAHKGLETFARANEFIFFLIAFFWCECVLFFNGHGF